MHFLKFHDSGSTQRTSLRRYAVEPPRRLKLASFEEHVRASDLRYFRPGMGFGMSNDRLLLGVSPHGSVIELRLADILNQQVQNRLARCQVDIFDLADIQSYEDSTAYFTQSVNIVSTPVAAYWSKGRLVDLLQGCKAMIMCMERVGIQGSYERLIGELCPPVQSHAPI